MPLYKTEAIVIRRTNLGEADRVVTLFTRDHGKLAVVAKGARKPKSRFAGRLELFTHLRLLLAVGRTLDVVSQVEVIDAFAFLRRDLTRLGYASLVAEVVDRATAEREPAPALFRLVRKTLELVRDHDSEVAALWFISHLLVTIGYGPNLNQCVICGRALRGTAPFSHALGGMLCPEDRERDPQAAMTAPVVRKTLQFLFDATPATLTRLVIDEQRRAEVSDLLQRYLEYRLEVRLRAPKVIDKLKSGHQTSAGHEVEGVR
jgi:DNA repair protein RecO (recombination protein O)